MLSTHTHKFQSFWMEFSVNCCRIASKILDPGFTKIRDILRSGKTQAGTRNTGPEIRDVQRNTGRLANLTGDSKRRTTKVVKVI